MFSLDMLCIFTGWLYYKHSITSKYNPTSSLLSDLLHTMSPLFSTDYADVTLLPKQKSKNLSKIIYIIQPPPSPP